MCIKNCVLKVQSPLTPHSTSTKASHQGDENPTTPAATLLDEAEAENIDPEIFWDSPDFVVSLKSNPSIFNSSISCLKKIVSHFISLPIDFCYLIFYLI